MRYAISTDGIFVSEHFGRCPAFTIIDIEDGKVMYKDELQNPGHSPGLIPQFLHNNKVNCIVSGGMGKRAMMFFEEFDIDTILGISGKIDDVINMIVNGSLVGGESLCSPGGGKGYGLDKDQCDHGGNGHKHC